MAQELENFTNLPVKITLNVVPPNNVAYSTSKYCYGVQNLLAKSISLLVKEGNLEEHIILQPFEYYSFVSTKTTRIIPILTTPVSNTSQ